MTASLFFWLWIASAVLTAVIAAAKDRNFMAWLLLGLVGGLFAAAYVAFAGPARPAELTVTPPAPRR
jgi:hypothetical protein